MAMPLAQKKLMLRELNKTGNNDYANDLDTIWDEYVTASELFPMSQYLYVKRHALMILMGEWYEKYDTEELDVVEKESQVFEHLLKLWNIVGSMIGSYEMAYAINPDPLIGIMTKKVHLEYLNRFVDPSSILLTGSPLNTLPYSLPVE